MQNKFSVILLVVIIFIHSFIISKLIYFPYPELFVYPYLTNQGLKPYSEIFDQHFPGLLFLPINFDNLGLNNEVIARGWSIGIVIIVHLLLFFISSQILKSKTKALLVNFLYFVWQPFFEGWVLWIDSFLPLLLLPAFYFLYKRKIFLCGLFLGFGVVFKQTILPLAFLVFLYLLWQTKSIKKTIYLLYGLALPIGLMILYLLSIGVIEDFLYWTIIFNLTVYAQYGTSIPATVGFITRVLLVYSTSLMGIFYKDKGVVFVLFLFLAGSLIGIFDRADFVHFQPSLPFAVLATTIGIYQLKRNTFFKAFAIVYIIISVWWLNTFYKGHISNKVFFFDENTKMIAQKIIQYTKKDEKVFVFGSSPHLYQMSDRLPPGNVYVYQFPWFLKVVEEDILKGIEEDQPKIIISDRTADSGGKPLKEFARRIDQYIQKNYQVIDNVGSVDIMSRKIP